MPQTSKNSEKKMEYKRVRFDVNEITPDAPAGEWKVSIPRGKCKVQPTKEDHYPMLIVPIRIEGTEEDGDEYTKAIGAELSTMIVFFGDEKARAARMSKLRLRQLCEAADVDLDVVPTDLEDPENDLDPLIRALEGKKFTCWTKLTQRKDTGETTTEVVFVNPNKPLAVQSDDEDEGEDEAPRGRGRAPAGRAKGAGTSNGRARR